MFGNDKTLVLIKEILLTTQENQKDIIDLRERAIKQDQKHQEHEAKLVLNAERQASLATAMKNELKDYTLAFFTPTKLHDKDYKQLKADLDGLEDRLETKFKSQNQLFSGMWQTAVTILAVGAWIYEKFLSHG